MSGIKKIFIVLNLFLIQNIQTSAQFGLLKQYDILAEIRQILSLTYNYEFTQARTKLAGIHNEIYDHPARTFLEALIVYWENYPLTLMNKNSDVFLNLMEETSKKSELMVEKYPDNLEVIFFALFSRAFCIMFWADNGKQYKVYSYLPFLYRQTIKGMERKYDFVEFYFSSGLYNYYVEAYPKRHPIYKSFTRFIKEGNERQGLDELTYCTKNALYLRVEAMYFLSLLYLGYENNIKKASEAASELYKEFPGNACFAANYAYVLLLDKDYDTAELIIRDILNKTDSFSSSQVHILNGYLLEKHKKDYQNSIKEYQTGLELSQVYQENANSYKAIAYMGIGRHYKRAGNMSEASRYFKLARNQSYNELVINDR